VGIILFGFVGITLCSKKVTKKIMQQNKTKITPLVLGSNFLLLELHFAAIDESTFSITLTVSNM
jgi:hypothetical protein